MVHYTCDMCGKPLLPDEDIRYVVKIEVHTACDAMEMDEDMDEEIEEMEEEDEGEGRLMRLILLRCWKTENIRPSVLICAPSAMRNIYKILYS